MCKQKVSVLEIMAKANDWVIAQHGHGIIVNGVSVRAPYRAEAHASRLVWFGLAYKMIYHNSGLTVLKCLNLVREISSPVLHTAG